MKEDKDWIEVMQESLREVEEPLPQGGWMRLSDALGARSVPPRVSLRGRGVRIAAVAAVVLVGVVVGEIVYHNQHNVGIQKGDVPAITAVTSVQSPAITLVEPVAIQPLLAVNSPRQSSQKELVTSKTTVPSAASDVLPLEKQTTAEIAPTTENVEPVLPTAPATPTDSPDTWTEKLRSKGKAIAAREESTVERRGSIRGRTSMGATVGGALASSSGGNGAGFYAMADMVGGDAVYPREPIAYLGARRAYEEYSYRHKQPLSVGLSVRKEFKYGLSLETGVVYTLLRSGVTVVEGADEISQRLHMLGIPLRMNWEFLRKGGFSLYAGVGGMGEKCLGAKFGKEHVTISSIQWSVFAAAGAQYDFGRHVGLFFEPTVSYYFTKTELRTSRTDSSASLNLQLGLRLTY